MAKDDDLKQKSGSLEDAQQKIAAIKSQFIGHRLEKVLVYGFWDFNSAIDGPITLPEYLAHPKHHIAYESPALLIFDNQKQLMIDLYYEYEYRFGVDERTVDNIVDMETFAMTKDDDMYNLTFRSREEYFDLSCMFRKNVIGKKLIDITAHGYVYEDYSDFEYLRLKFEDGCYLFAKEGLDNTNLSAVKNTPLFCRKAEEKDADDVAWIHNRTWLTSYYNLIPQEVLHQKMTDKTGIDKERQRINRGLAYVIETENEIVGFLTLGDTIAEETEIAIFYVLQEYQDMGIGSRLLKFVLEDLKNNGCKKVFLWTLKDFLPSNKFYTKHGAILTGEEKDWKYGLKIVKYEFNLSN